jgi:filamentous hemagglutinin
LPFTFKTFDFFDESTGLAISAKTLDTQTGSRLGNPKQICSILKKYVNDVARFTRDRVGKKIVLSSDISVREIHLAIPTGTTKAQWDQINRAVAYGQQKNVAIKITEVK